MEMADILATVADFEPRHVTVTGGEPLAQKSCLELLSSLCDESCEVSLETSGALDISDVDSRVIKVMDVKTPGSGEADKNLVSNFDYLDPDDQIKFVLCDRSDYAWAVNMIEEYALANVCEVLFSPSFKQLDATQLADWILEDRLPVRMQIQLHKYLWDEEPGR